MDAIQAITVYDVLVGFPDSGEERKPEELASTFTAKGKRIRHFKATPSSVTNAYIAFIQEQGSPAANIPARPFMIPGIKSINTRAARMLEQAAIAAMQGEPAKGLVILNQLGLSAVAAVQRAITVGAGWPPLSELTLAARRARGVKRTHPLIDTGQLRQHVEYVIRKRQRKYNSITGIEYLSKVKHI